MEPDDFEMDLDDDGDWGEAFDEGVPQRKNSRGGTIVVGIKANPLDNQAWDDDFLLEGSSSSFLSLFLSFFLSFFLWVFLGFWEELKSFFSFFSFEF